MRETPETWNMSSLLSVIVVVATPGGVDSASRAEAHRRVSRHGPVRCAGRRPTVAGNLTSLRERLSSPDGFVHTFELVPGASARGRTVDRILDFARAAADDGLLDALTITDNPGGSPSLSPDAIAAEIAGLGMATVVHFTCRDANRYGMFSRAQQLDRMGVENLLVLTGDYPAARASGVAKPCFDLDSVTLLCLLGRMNRGSQAFCGASESVPIEPTRFYLGAAVSCCKKTEAETVTQYLKLVRKVRNGAEWVVTQLCYDSRKLHELLVFLRGQRLDVPVIGSVSMLRRAAARVMNAGVVPGAMVSDRLYRIVCEEAEGDDRGRAACIERTARLIAVLRGLGYRGAHIEGPPVYEDVRRAILRAREVQSDWRDLVQDFQFGYEDGFHLFERDDATGLNREIEVGQSPPSWRGRIARAFFGCFHWLMFERKARHYPLLPKAVRAAERVPAVRAVLELLEDVPKSLLFDCRRCGDCALPDMAYFCPESQCPKYLRNGPCGGSDGGRCEVRRERLCVWVRVHDRLSAAGAEESLAGPCVPPRNWGLSDTSSWLNFYLERDHHRTRDREACPCREAGGGTTAEGT